MNKPQRNEDLMSAHPGASTDDQPAAELSELARRTALQLRSKSYAPTIVTGTLRLVDFAGVALVGFLTSLACRGFAGLPQAMEFLAGAAPAVMALQVADAYELTVLRAATRGLPRLLLAWTAGFGPIAAVIALIGGATGATPLWLASWFVAGAVLLVLSHAAVALTMRKWARNGRMERRAVVVGGGTGARDLIRALEREPSNDIRICGIFDDRARDRSPDVVAGYPKLGNLRDLVAFVRLARIDMLIIALPITAEARVLDMLKSLWVLPVDIRLAAHANKLRFRARSYSHVGSIPMLDILDRPIANWDSVAKRVFDIVFAALALALLWPVMAVTAAAVKLTSQGPIFFRQKRHGFNNEEIDVYKFRSMYVGDSDPAAKVQVTRHDPRVTPLGRFIRKTSIDELPQLFNVLKGDLSLVGPRPHAVAARGRERFFVEVVEGYFARHRVKPGVTGWAQINGWRGETDTDEKIRQRVACDLYYIENWSLLFDLRILFLTPFRLLDTRNAY